MDLTSDKKALSDWLIDFRTIVTGIVIGIFLALYVKTLIPVLAWIADIYLSLLKMCVIPIMLTAIISGLGSLIRTSEVSHHLKRLVVIFVAGVFLSSGIGLTTGLIGKPGLALSKSEKAEVGALLLASEKEDDGENSQSTLSSFIKNIVPDNIFAALSEGRNLRVVFFSILIALALGMVRSRTGDDALALAQVFYEVFTIIYRWLLYALPFGLCCIFATQVSKMNIGLIIALTKFILLLYVGGLVLLSIYHIVIWLSLRCSFFHAVNALKETLLLAFASDNSFVPIPEAIRSLSHDLNVDDKMARLIVPLGVVMNRQGIIMVFAMTCIFLAQIYNIPIGPGAVGIILVGSAVAGMAAIGIGGTLAVELAVVVQALGLPVETAVTILVAASPFTGPLQSLLNVHANCASAALFPGDRQKG
jgi:proton glutamate symport protein